MCNRQNINTYNFMLLFVLCLGFAPACNGSGRPDSTTCSETFCKIHCYSALAGFVTCVHIKLV